MPLIIFPSLSRAAAFGTERTLGDEGTLKDPMESGYVATRPRFTRLRRKFTVAYKNLNAEDVRALDRFETLTVQGGAGSFYLPNLLPNGSFEQPSDAGSGEVVRGWMADGNTFVASVTAPGSDGQSALVLSSLAQTVPANTSVCGEVDATWPQPGFAVDAGDVLSFAGQINVVAGVGSALIAQLTVSYQDGTTQMVIATLASAPSAGWTPVGCTFTVPAGSAPSLFATFALLPTLTAGNSPMTVADGQVAYTLDSVGLALTSAAQPYGRLPGTSPTASLVRLTKPIAIRDSSSKWLGTAKAYDASFEVTEV